MIWNLNIQGNLPKICFPTSWLSDQCANSNTAKTCTFRFGGIQKVLRIVGKRLPQPIGVFRMLPSGPNRIEYAATNDKVGFILYNRVLMQNRPNRNKYRAEPIPTWDNWSHWGGLRPPRHPLHFLGGGLPPSPQTRHPRIMKGFAPRLHIEYREYQNTEPLPEPNRPTENNLGVEL